MFMSSHMRRMVDANSCLAIDSQRPSVEPGDMYSFATGLYDIDESVMASGNPQSWSRPQSRPERDGGFGGLKADLII